MKILGIVANYRLVMDIAFFTDFRPATQIGVGANPGMGTYFNRSLDDYVRPDFDGVVQFCFRINNGGRMNGLKYSSRPC